MAKKKSVKKAKTMICNSPSQAEKYYIGENPNNLSVDELKAELPHLAKSDIEKLIKTNKEVMRSVRPSSDLLARQDGVVIMTEAAGQAADEYKKSNRKGFNDRPDCIYKIDKSKKAR